MEINRNIVYGRPMPIERRQQALESLHDLCWKLTKPYGELLARGRPSAGYIIEGDKITPMPETPEHAEIFKQVKNILDAAKLSWRRQYEMQGWDMDWTEVCKDS